MSEIDYCDNCGEQVWIRHEEDTGLRVCAEYGELV